MLRRLYVQVLIAVAVGVLVGWLRPEWGLAMKPLGDGFIKIIKMLIAPIVFTTVAVGIAGMGDLKRLGRVGIKTMVWFEITTLVALALGLLVTRVINPGAGMHVSLDTLDTSALDKTLAVKREAMTWVEQILHMIPDSFVGAFVGGEVLQVLVLATLTGIALAAMGQRGHKLVAGLDNVSHGLFALVAVVMHLAPIGAFGAMAYTIGRHGLVTLGSLAQVMLAFYVTSLLFVFGFLGLTLWLVGRISIVALVRYLREELLIVLGTSSSESALPSLMQKLEKVGIAPAIVRLVVPTGYTFNLDGTVIYMTMAALFTAQALDVPLTLGEQLGLLGILIITSKGAAAVTGSGFVTLAATLQSFGNIPVGGLSLLIGIDRFMSEARALTNFMGNAGATFVIARWENALSAETAREALRRRPVRDAVDEPRLVVGDEQRAVGED
jgi:aerobic C4-dicarboxylate transport protein